MKLEREIVESIWVIKKEIYNRISLDNVRLEQRDEIRSKCVRFYYRWSIIDEV